MAFQCFSLLQVRERCRDGSALGLFNLGLGGWLRVLDMKGQHKAPVLK